MTMGRRRTTDFDLPPRMLRRGDVYYYKSPTIRKRLSEDWNEAYRLYQELEGPIDAARTVGQAIIHYEMAVLPGKAPATQREYGRYAMRLRKVFADERLENVTAGHVAQYLRKRSASVEGNREISMLSSVYQEAMAQGWCDANPCRGARRNPEKPATVVPTATEVQRLLLAADAQWQCMLKMELATAARKEDLLAIRLSDWSEAGLSMEQSKTGARILYERTPELEELWARCRKLRRRIGSLYLFAGRKGQRYTTSGFDSIWQRLRKRAKIRQDVTFHSLRAYVITEAERLYGMDYARRIAGHKSTATTQRYVRTKETIRVSPMKVPK